jgi:hypothetical protein
MGKKEMYWSSSKINLGSPFCSQMKIEMISNVGNPYSYQTYSYRRFINKIYCDSFKNITIKSNINLIAITI